METQTQAEDMQVFSRQHASGEVYDAQNIEAARGMCPVLGRMSLEEAGLLLELEAMGKQLMAAKVEMPDENVATKPDQPEKSAKKPSVISIAEHVEAAIHYTEKGILRSEDTGIAPKAFAVHKLALPAALAERISHGFHEPAIAAHRSQLVEVVSNIPKVTSPKKIEAQVPDALSKETLPPREVEGVKLDPPEALSDMTPAVTSGVDESIHQPRVTARPDTELSEPCGAEMQPLRPEPLGIRAVEQRSNTEEILYEEHPPLTEPVSVPVVLDEALLGEVDDMAASLNDSENIFETTEPSPTQDDFEASELEFHVEVSEPNSNLVQNDVPFEEILDTLLEKVPIVDTSLIGTPAAAPAEGTSIISVLELPTPHADIDALIQQLVETMGTVEPVETENSSPILESIIALQAILEDSPDTTDQAVEQKLEALFRELFESAGMIYTPAQIDSIIKQTRAHYMKTISGTVGVETERQLPHEIGTREFLQKLMQGLSSIKQSTIYFYEIGKLALRSDMASEKRAGYFAILV